MFSSVLRFMHLNQQRFTIQQQVVASGGGARRAQASLCALHLEVPKIISVYKNL